MGGRERGQRVNANVLYFDEAGGQHFVKKGAVPDKAFADKLGDHLFTDSAEGSDDNGGVPPQSGKGSGKDAWSEYAASVGVAVPDDATRDDIIAAVAEAGHPVE